MSKVDHKSKIRDPSPATQATALQKETRTANNFTKVGLELQTLPTLHKSIISAIPSRILSGSSKLFSFLGPYNPLASGMRSCDVIWVLDSIAYPVVGNSEQGKENSPVGPGHYRAEVQVTVLENCNKDDVAAALFKAFSGAILDAVLKTGTQEEKNRIVERVAPFMADLRTGRMVEVAVGEGKEKEMKRKLKPTDIHGVSRTTLDFKGLDQKKRYSVEAVVPEKIEGILGAEVFVADAEGWMIISDIDDTIKITGTTDPIAILKETLANEARVVPGMPELYEHIQQTLPQDSVWCYVTASPNLLYPFLRKFRTTHYPDGPILLRDIDGQSINSIIDLLTTTTLAYKRERIDKLRNWLPKRKVLMVGDSTQADPEVYGEMARSFQEWVGGIMIRKVLDMKGSEAEKKNAERRFEVAFKGVPREKWCVFEKAEEAREFFDGLQK